MALSVSRRLVYPLACAVLFLLLPSLALHGQGGPQPDAASGASSSSKLSASRTWRDVSPTLLPVNFLRDQEEIWFFPYRLAHGQHWSATVAAVAASSALLSADPYAAPYFNHTTVFRGFNRAFGSNLTGAETIAIPTALYVIGLHRRDTYMQKTALFAGEAVADSEVLRAFMNSVTARWRPSDVFRRRSYADTFFRNTIDVGSSFPSGHMIAAVSVATVIATIAGSPGWPTV
jgi:hypothetical protein